MTFSSRAVVLFALSLSAFSNAFAKDEKSAATPAAAPKAAKVVNKYEIKVIDIVHQNTVSYRASAPIAQSGMFIDAAMGNVDKYMNEKKIAPTGAPYVRTYSFKDGKMDFECGYPVKDPIKTEGDIFPSELPKGKAATTVHVGAQENSQKAYKAIEAWLKKNNKKAMGAPWEVYISEAGVKPEEAKIQIYYPF